MRTNRDFQRERVYAWERQVGSDEDWHPVFATLQECQSWLGPIWAKERGRYGRPNVPAPLIERPSWGQQKALAYGNDRITLPRWARSHWVILHEAAHRLAHRHKDVAHGPRFVGVLIGLVCRHLDYDAQELMRQADAAGVRYDVRCIGSVPVHGAVWHVERVLREEGAMTPMDIACALSIVHGHDLSLPQIHGAALQLLRTGRARWFRGKLVPLVPASELEQSDACEQRLAA